MNLIISGWPAAGTSTLALILSKLLDYRYLSGGELMKHFATRITGRTSGPVYIEFEQKYGEWFDFIWEPYAIWKLGHSKQLLLEAKTAGFFVEDKENLFEIMLIANQAARESRAATDKREAAELTLQQRDLELQKRWLGKYNIDIFSIKQIQANYDLVIDNSGLSVADELDMILSHLEEDYRFPQSNLEAKRKELKKLMELYARGGKAEIKKLLETGNLIVPIAEVIEDWRQNFKQELGRLPDQMRTVVAAEIN